MICLLYYVDLCMTVQGNTYNLCSFNWKKRWNDHPGIGCHLSRLILWKLRFGRLPLAQTWKWWEDWRNQKPLHHWNVWFDILWVVPPPSNSHHQDYYIFSRGSLQTFISTITGRGDNPRYTTSSKTNDWSNSLFDFLLKSYSIIPDHIWQRGGKPLWDDELPWKFLVMVWLSLDFDTSHVLFWFKWCKYLQWKPAEIQGGSQFVQWMSRFCLGANISYYMNLYDTTLLQTLF